MRFGLLGPLEVRTDEKVLRLGGAKQRALLAILLVHANEVVSRDRLIEEIWPDRPPGGAAHSLDHQISRLRKVLDPPDTLVTRSGGYMLRATPGDIDVHRFEENLERGRQANAAGTPTEALAALDTCARPLARAGPRRRRRRAVPPRRSAAARRAAADRAGGTVRRTTCARRAPPPRGRARRARPTPSASGASAGAIDARPVSVGSSGRGTTRLRRREACTRRRARSGARAGAAAAGAVDPAPGSVARRPASCPPRPSQPDRCGSHGAPRSGGHRRRGDPGQRRGRLRRRQRATVQCSRVGLGANRQGARPHRRAERPAAVEVLRRRTLEPVRDGHSQQDRSADREGRRQRQHRRRSVWSRCGRGGAVGLGLQLADRRPGRSRPRRRRRPRDAARSVRRARRRYPERGRRRGFGLGRSRHRQSELRLAARSGKRARPASLRHPGGGSAGAGVRRRRTMGRGRRDRPPLAHRSGHQRGDLAGTRSGPMAVLRRRGRRLRLGGNQSRRDRVEVDRARRRGEQHQARRFRPGARLRRGSPLGGGRGRGPPRPDRSRRRTRRDRTGSATPSWAPRSTTACWR